MRRTILLLASTALTVLLVCGVALAAAGDLDPEFDTDGKVMTSLSPGRDGGNAVVIQSDGKVVVAGAAESSNTGSDFALARYNSNGAWTRPFTETGS